MRILGIDPGLKSLGWGVIHHKGAHLSYIASGHIRPMQTDFSARLAHLFKELCNIVSHYEPTAAAIEQTFVNTNAASALKLGQARGVAILAPALAGLDVGEYAPNAVKKIVTGAGHADKTQIARLVKMQLRDCPDDAADKGWDQKHDAMDALAIAICHAVHMSCASVSKRLAS